MNVKQWKRQLRNDIATIQADLDEVEKVEADCLMVANAIPKRRRKVHFDEGSFLIAVDLEKPSRKLWTKDTVLSGLDPVLVMTGAMNMSPVFETPNSVGIFATIADKEVAITLNKNNKGVKYACIDPSGKCEGGKKREQMFPPKKGLDGKRSIDAVEKYPGGFTNHEAWRRSHL